MQTPITLGDKIEIRLQAVKVAPKTASPQDGIAHVLIHASWLEKFIPTGIPPEVDTLQDSRPEAKA